MRIHKGDEVIVIAGKDKGKKGKVEKVFPSASRIAVAGVNLYKKHLKARTDLAQAGIVDMVKPLPVSNVSLICPKCNLATRVSFAGAGKDKVRICKNCKQSF